MAIQNNDFFIVLGGPGDFVGASEFSSTRGTVIGGGAIDEHQALLENSIMVYSALNRAVVAATVSVNDNAQFTTSSASYVDACECPARVGDDRQSISVEVDATGQCKVFVYESSSDTELDNDELSDSVDTRKIQTGSLTWSTTTAVYFRVQIKKTGASDAEFYGARFLEDKTTL